MMEAIAPEVLGMEALDQAAVDKRMIGFDGTPTESQAGGQRDLELL